MKKALLFVAAIVCLASCQKDNSEINAGLFGKWELRLQYGGLTGAVHKFNPGNGDTYQFNTDSTYVRMEDNKVRSSGKFHIEIEGNDDGLKYGSIELEGINFTDTFSIKKDTIIIGTSIADGIISQYVKIQ